MLLTHIQMEKSEKVRATFELQADEVILPTSFDFIFNQVLRFQRSPAQMDSQDSYSIYIKITNVETNLIPQKLYKSSPELLLYSHTQTIQHSSSDEVNLLASANRH